MIKKKGFYLNTLFCVARRGNNKKGKNKEREKSMFRVVLNERPSQEASTKETIMSCAMKYRI